jgi:outer membrane immunogenic protein
MKKLLILAAVAFAGAAHAADLTASGGYKDPASLSAPSSWSGGYAGATIGGGFVTHDVAYPGALDFNGIGAQDVIGGFVAGYDKQIGKLVIGVYGDYDFSNVKSTLSISGINASLDLDHTWSLGARGGILLSSSTLLYGTVGYGEAEFKLSGIPYAGYDHTYKGLTLGGGVESYLGAGFTGRIEYRWYDLDTDSNIQGSGLNNTPSLSTDKAGIVWHIPGSDILH